MRYQKATGQGELLICSMRLNSLEGFIAKPNFVRGADETKGLVIKRFIPAISNRKSQWVGLLYIYFRHINLPDGSNSNSSKIGPPGFIDYLFLAFTNPTAFSPADTLPLTTRAKLPMMAEAAISLCTIAIVASRAVGIRARCMSDEELRQSMSPLPVQLTGLVGNAVCIVAAAGAIASGAVSEWSRIAVRRAAMAKRS